MGWRTLTKSSENMSWHILKLDASEKFPMQLLNLKVGQMLEEKDQIQLPMEIWARSRPELVAKVIAGLS